MDGTVVLSLANLWLYNSHLSRMGWGSEVPGCCSASRGAIDRRSRNPWGLSEQRTETLLLYVLRRTNVMLERVHGQFEAVRDTKLLEDVVEVVLDGLLANE